MTLFKPGALSYENAVLIIVGLAVGCITVDRLAVNFLAPYIMEDLGLTNMTLGLLSAALSLAWAIAGYTIGKFADASGRRKNFLLGSVIVFSLSSALSGFAGGFASLLVARLIMGFSEGPVIPIGQTMMALESSPHRRGFNMGFTQNFCASILGPFLTPLVLIWIADAYGWRAAFFVTGVPGLALAICIAIFLRKDTKPSAGRVVESSGSEGGDLPSISAAERRKNLWVCGLLAGAMGAWLIVQNAFLPLYLVRVAGMTTAKMGLAMSMIGVGSVVGSLMLPALSDRIGRKPVMVLGGLLALISPLAILYLYQDFVLLTLALFVGWLGVGCVPLYMSTIPAETVSRSQMAGAVGLIMGTSELVGGVAAPLIAGWAGDHFGLTAPFVIAGGMAVATCLLSFLLLETAPCCARKSRAMSTCAMRAKAK